MASAFVSKSRRLRFELSLRIIDLNNVPLVSGTSYIKWHLPSSTAAEHRGRTNKCAIKDHRVNYDYEKTASVRLIIGKDGVLQECPIDFEVMQEYSSGGRAERLTLGNIKLNLSEYVDAAEAMSPTSPTHLHSGTQPDTSPVPNDDDDRITRRYLMQDSKINSTLKLSIRMRQLEGTHDYTVPTLRTAPVFGGIAGIISSSEPVVTSASDQNLPHPNLSSSLGGMGAKPSALDDPDLEDQAAALANLNTSNRELGEMQDMYRRTLAAYWASAPGELKADECIEDIFAGGDGWGKKGRPRGGGEDGHHGGHHHHRHDHHGKGGGVGEEGYSDEDEGGESSEYDYRRRGMGGGERRRVHESPQRRYRAHHYAGATPVGGGHGYAQHHSHGVNGGGEGRYERGHARSHSGTPSERQGRHQNGGGDEDDGDGGRSSTPRMNGTHGTSSSRLTGHHRNKPSSSSTSSRRGKVMAYHRGHGEVEEMDVREDLVGWHISAEAAA